MEHDKLEIRGLSRVAIHQLMDELGDEAMAPGSVHRVDRYESLDQGVILLVLAWPAIKALTARLSRTTVKLTYKLTKADGTVEEGRLSISAPQNVLEADGSQLDELIKALGEGRGQDSGAS